MVEAKTYANRSNAKRAGVTAGNLVERVEITVKKSPQGVRFGWQVTATPRPAADERLMTTLKTTAEAIPATVRVERNGIKRPTPGGRCASVWAWLDSNPQATAKMLRAVAGEMNWNENNALCEFYAWRKFSSNQCAR